MDRTFLALLLCILVLTFASCRSDTASRSMSDAEEVGPDATIDLGFDLGVPDFLPSDTRVEDAPDDTPIDSDPSLRLTFAPLTTQCDRWGVGGGTLEVTLAWTTTLATVCDLIVSFNDGPQRAIEIGEVVPEWVHEYVYPLTMFDASWTSPPQVGDTIALMLTCTAEGGMGTVSQAQTLELGRGQRECIWPFDDGCSDGSLVTCNRGLEMCPAGAVAAVTEGCPRCVYADTCTCDDGSELVCDSVPPECGPGEVVAVQEGCYNCVNQFTCLPAGELPCPTYIGALADCAYQWHELESEDGCPIPVCLEEPCQSNDDCLLTNAAGQGDQCVTGNCVACWQDNQCTAGERCRAGRCVDETPPYCPATSLGEDVSCNFIALSEAPCDVFVCYSRAAIPCSNDIDCQVISSFQYRSCVYGRCAECRNDDDCGNHTCLPPGFCSDERPHPEALYGTWLIGWSGGMNHFSYFRFEADGTLRRSQYEEPIAWSDDFPPLICEADELEYPLLGTWEYGLDHNSEGTLRLALNQPCDDGEGWRGVFWVAFTNDNERATFDDVNSEWVYEGLRVPTEQCKADFSFCLSPEN